MKTNILFCTIVLAAMFLSSCRIVTVKKHQGTPDLSEANTTAEASSEESGCRVFDNLPSCSTIVFEGVADIEYTQGPARVELRAPENIIEHLVVQTTPDSALLVTTDKSRIRDWSGVQVFVSMPEVRHLSLAGAGKFRARAIGSSDKFHMDCSGAADVQIDSLSASDADVEINGAGKVVINGISCGSIDVEINGAGNVRLAGNVDTAKLEINGVGNIDVSNLVRKDLQAWKTGLGSITDKEL